MATVYINNVTGNDTTGNGTEGNPWQTIGQAISNTVNGDTIIFQNSGTDYALNNYPFRFNNRIFEGELDNTGALVVEADMGGGFISNQDFDVSHTVKNMKIKNINSTAQTPQSTLNRGYFNIGANITLTWENVWLDNVYTGANTSRSDLGGLWHIDNGNTPTLNFTGCIFSNLGIATGSSRQFLTSASVGDFFTNFTNCTIDMTPPSGTNAWSHFIARNATSLEETQTFRNSIVYGNFSNACEFVDNTATDDMNYADNLVYVTGGGSFTSITITNCIQSDPLFADRVNGDYTLLTNSPARGAGNISL